MSETTTRAWRIKTTDANGGVMLGDVHREPGACQYLLRHAEAVAGALCRDGHDVCVQHDGDKLRVREFVFQVVYVTAVEDAVREEINMSNGKYFCAGPSCPGLPYRASDIGHPASCAVEPKHPSPSVMARRAYPDEKADFVHFSRHHYAAGVAAERARVVKWLREQMGGRFPFWAAHYAANELEGKE